MGVKVRIDGIMVATVVAVGGAAYLYSQRKKIADKVNPASTSNVIYDDIVGGIGRELTGDQHWTLGGQIYDWTH